MKTVLFIAYHFPPQPGGGVQRSAKFVRYLPEFGWRPVVLTIDGTLHGDVDDSLLADVAGADVVRVRASTLPDVFVRRRALRGALDRLLVPDGHIAWLPIAERAAEKLWRVRGFDLVYTSCRPFSLAPLGARLQEKYGVPWVLDLRDLWTLNPAFNSMAVLPGQRRAHANHERAAVQACTHLVVTSESSLRAMRRMYPELAGKSDCIPNGFDAGDFSGDEPVRGSAARRFVYVGACYPPYSPERTLEIVRRWREQSGVPCEIHYAGLHERPFLRAAERAGARSLVRTHGHLSHQASIALMRSADVLLLFLPDIAEAEGWVPGKLYEYLACQAPVFACASAGDAADIIRRSGAGTVVAPDAPIDDAVAALDRLNGEGGRFRDRGVVSQYERRRLTGRLATIFDQVTSRTVGVRCAPTALAQS